LSFSLESRSCTFSCRAYHSMLPHGVRVGQVFRLQVVMPDPGQKLVCVALHRPDDLFLSKRPAHGPGHSEALAMASRTDQVTTPVNVCAMARVPPTSHGGHHSMKSTEPRANGSRVKTKEATAKGKTRLVPAGTMERALQGRPR